MHSFLAGFELLYQILGVVQVGFHVLDREHDCVVVRDGVVLADDVFAPVFAAVFAAAPLSVVCVSLVNPWLIVTL